MAKLQIISPLPGTFYHRPSPDDPPYKLAGDNVAEGDVIGLVEVMKSFHEVKSNVSGKLTAYLVENEDPVQAGQALADIEG